MLPIVLRGARTHNLKGVDLDLAPGELVALVGPSGSGKSSLAIDTLYAEGQRRFVESFSPYARQFLERLPRPPIDSLAPIAAGVAVDRRVQVKSSRSTLATLADLEAYLAALFAKEALPVCPHCERLAEWVTADMATDRLLQTAATRGVFTFAYPLRSEADSPIEAFLEARDKLAQAGFRRLFVGGKAVDLDEVRPSDFGGSVRVVADRVQLTAANRSRIVAAFESAWEHGAGLATVDLAGTEFLARRGLACPGCGLAFDPPRPGLFSYNSPLGACPACRGFGRLIDVDWAKVIPDGQKTLAKGAIRTWSGKSSEWERGALGTFAKKAKIPLDVPWDQLSAEQRRLVIEGDGAASGEMVWEGRYPGVRAWFKWLETKTYKMHVRVLLARYREFVPCAACGGGRLNDKARRYRVGDLDLPGWHKLDVQEAHARVIALTPHDPQGARIVGELSQRLSMLDRVGLGYLTLDRQARTLSGGEVQRASLTTALASQLTQALFVLDEPTVGLHPEDVGRLSGIVRELADAGNTVVVIEHDSRIVEKADRVVEMGPGAGAGGGAIVAIGPPVRRRARRPKARPAREAASAHVTVTGVGLHNLRIDRIAVPLGQLVAIVGASGSGKSTLAARVLYPLLARHTGDTSVLAAPAEAGSLVQDAGLAQIKEVVLVDQAPLGRTARGNAATYTKAWNRIRERFAGEPMAQREGLQASHFSFNVAGKDSGRCEACDGEGFETVEMQFLADVHFPCPVCLGKRFRPEILRVRHEGKSVADVLEMTVSEVLSLFHSKAEPDYVLQRALTPLVELGLSYLPLGQPLSTLSGGEAQRLKLARGLAGAKPGMLFLLDEPSAGLAPSDTAGVVDALFKLTKLGASVLVVEHDLDVVTAADHVIELGPDAGPRGGFVVFEGPPDQLAGQDTKTGRALADDRAGGPKSKRATKPKASTRAGIEVTGATEHNLKNVSCTIPEGAITVVTGPSGSGKSSLAFDVIYAEGQRRFMETLTPYARQFLPTLPRPNVERVANVPPSIALEQRESRGGTASTVATITEVSHFLRLLFAKLGEPVCLECGGRVRSASRADVDAALRARGSESITLYARAVARRKGTYASVFSAAARQGIQGARVDGEICAVDPPPTLKRQLEHTIDLIVYFGPADALDPKLVARALEHGKGAIRVGKGQPSRSDRGEAVMSLVRACEDCGAGVPELEPGHFSFSTQEGRCPACEGKGVTDTGRTCKICQGERLGPRGRTTTLFGDTLPAFMRRDVASALSRAEGWTFTGSAAEIGAAPQKELARRLAFAARVGLEYLALERHASTLSGGELQRLALAAQLGSGLTGALYVLDEPTIGLHPRDTDRLLGSLRDLTAMGSTVLVVEHDVNTIRAADFVIDMGPEGGRGGGHVVASGPAASVLAGDGPTARAVREATLQLRTPSTPDRFLELLGASGHNLRNVDLRLPIGRLSVIAGPSGSGKSTLVRGVLLPAVRRALGLETDAPLPFSKLKNLGGIDRALSVDQSPIGRTPRSVPATFVGVWDEIRKLYAALPEAKMRGFGPARFSFNAKGPGRCSGCDGQGFVVSEMSFLPDVVHACETCQGLRFAPETLEIRYRGKNAGEALAMTAREAAELFVAHPKIRGAMKTLDELGVGYLQIGQPSNTLSGGEAQRLKLAAELSQAKNPKPTLYVLDEPTTGLHLLDVRKLLGVFDRLLARGDTLVVIEHHEEVIRNADWVVELGPDGGTGGGEVVFEGTAADLVRAPTATGLALR